MYQKILVPVDDSKASLKALKEACMLAEQLKAKLHIVHIVDLQQFNWIGGDYLQSSKIHDVSKEVSEKILDSAVEVIKKFNLEYETQIMESVGEKVAGIIAGCVKENQCDLVVMGTHGFTGVMHLLMGSVAEGVLRQVSVPVMLVRRLDDD